MPTQISSNNIRMSNSPDKTSEPGLKTTMMYI